MVWFKKGQDKKGKDGFLNIPNCVTLSRIFIFLPAVLLATYQEKFLAGLLFYTIGALTDWLDGHLARLLNKATAIGKILDPLADKIFILCTLSFGLRVPAALRWWWTALLIGEGILVIIGLGGYLLLKDKGTAAVSKKIGANIFGKTKFILEVIFTLSLFFEELGWADEVVILGLTMEPAMVLRSAVPAAVMSILTHVFQLFSSLPEKAEK